MALDFPATPAIGSKFVAPNGSTWQWDGVKWIAVAGSAIVASGNVGRNLLDNSLFNVQQRGQGPWTAGGYTADRWVLSFVGDAVSVSTVVLTDADRAAIGDEAAQAALQNVFTGVNAAGNYTFVTQKIENVRRLSGKTVTMSGWVKASAALNLGVNMNQNFGSGGSPSAQVNLPGVAIPLAVGWNKISSSFALPSSAAKTLGTNGDNLTSLNLWYSSGSGAAANSGIGVQSGTITLWGMQLEIQQPGQVQPSSLEKPYPQQDLDRCQRFYTVLRSLLISGYTPAASAGIAAGYTLPTSMRATPTVSLNPVSSSNATGTSVNGSTPTAFAVSFVTPAAGNGYVYFDTFASADL